VICIVMGVAGVGKTAVGSALARARGAVFVDGDDYHSPESVARMARGQPLDEAARAPWLERLAERVAEARARGGELVLACSALRRAHREALCRGSREDVLFVHLVASVHVLAERIEGRAGHFMPATLLASQLATLEPPGPDERALVLGATRSVPDLVDAIVAELRLGYSDRAGRER
jgi:gluconokinase